MWRRRRVWIKQVRENETGDNGTKDIDAGDISSRKTDAVENAAKENGIDKKDTIDACKIPVSLIFW